MQYVEVLFMETLKELEARVSAQDPYMILGASALIRKLLLDDFPLVDQVNRQYRLKLTFEVTEPPNFPPGLPEPMFYSVQDAIDPETVRPGKAKKTVNRDQLLSYVLAKVDGRPYTLREIVLFEANVMGESMPAHRRKTRTGCFTKSTRWSLLADTVRRCDNYKQLGA